MPPAEPQTSTGKDSAQPAGKVTLYNMTKGPIALNAPVPKEGPQAARYGALPADIVLPPWTGPSDPGVEVAADLWAKMESNVVIKAYIDEARIKVKK